MKKVVAITGASSGIGKSTVEKFAQNGWTVYAVARHIDRIPQASNVQPIKVDVTNSKDNHDFIDTIKNKEGRLDVLINVAGYGEMGPTEEITMDKARRQFEINFFGAAELAQLALPIMRKQHSGRIVNVSSIGGDIYSPFGAYYHASKAALQQWSDTLDLEIRQFGIKSVVVQPGGTRTPWGNTAMDKVKDNLKDNSPYKKFAEAVSESMGNISKRASSTPEKVASVIYDASTTEKPKRRYYTKFSDHMTVNFINVFPNLYRRLMLRYSNNLNK